jgi:hypothetical protein
MRKNKRSWFIAALAVLGIGSAVGVSAARGPAPAPALIVSSAADLPLPALDRMVARLAAEARGADRN